LALLGFAALRSLAAAAIASLIPNNEKD